MLPLYRITISQRAPGTTLSEQTDGSLIVLSNKDKKLVTRRRHIPSAEKGVLVFVFFFFLTQSCSIIALSLQKKHKSGEVKSLGMFLCA